MEVAVDRDESETDDTVEGSMKVPIGAASDGLEFVFPIFCRMKSRIQVNNITNCE